MSTKVKKEEWEKVNPQKSAQYGQSRILILLVLLFGSIDLLQ